MGTRRCRMPRGPSADDVQPASFFDLQRRCAIATSLRKPKSGCRLPYDPAHAPSAGSCAQPPLALVRETLWESRLSSLLRAVSQRRPLEESSPIQKKTPSAPPARTRLSCHSWISSPASLAETSIVCRFAGSTGRLFTHLRRSPLAIGNKGKAPLRLPEKARTAGGELPLPPLTRQDLHVHSWQAFGNIAARVMLWITHSSRKLPADPASGPPLRARNAMNCAGFSQHRTR